MSGVLTTTAYGEINLAVQAMKMGAVDFIIKPWNKEQLIASVQNVFQLREVREVLKRLKGIRSMQLNHGEQLSLKLSAGLQS